MLDLGNFGVVTKRLLERADRSGYDFVAAKEIKKANIDNCTDLLSEATLMSNLMYRIN